MRLLLFDIDGTLLTSNGAAGPAILQALSDLVGRSIELNGITFSGKTDPLILREILEANGVPEDQVEALLPHALQAYATLASSAITADTVRALPGAQALLDALASKNNAQLALLTGNIERTAYLKLGAVGLDGYFTFGAFGSDDGNRNALPPIACRRAGAALNRRVALQDAVIIGDTPRDIACGRAHGCRTVAVATGAFDADALAAHAPDELLPDLNDTRAVLTALMG
ncbi:MAG: HAD hydrolase-like protein [Bacteroidetes bacterium]|jgi:phosphoglycolate phosphatase-like HAD superfamily hydrolase|nr:HAD hydrolase-like protein [Bacteroidota bacterium]